MMQDPATIPQVAGELRSLIYLLGGGMSLLILKEELSFMKSFKKNGNGKACPLHAVLAQEIVTLHGENRTDHQKIFDDIKGLSVAVAGAASAAASAAAAAAAATARRPRTNDRA